MENKKSLINLAKEAGYTREEFKAELLTTMSFIGLKDLDSQDNEQKGSTITYFLISDRDKVAVSVTRAEELIEEVSTDEVDEVVAQAIKEASEASKH